MNEENVWDKVRWAGVTEINFDFMTGYIVEKFLECVSPAGKSVLELGAGMGRLSYRLLENGARDVTLVDSSEKALALSGKLFEGVPSAQWNIVDSDVFTFGSDRKYDLVFSGALIEHFDGEARRRLIETHLAHCSGECILIHPSDRLYNRVFDRTFIARRRYGFARTYSEDELNGYLEDHPAVASVHHRRFHFFYTVPLLHNIEKLNRWCEGTFLGDRWGGLCMTHIVLKKNGA